MSGICGIKNFDSKEQVNKEILQKMCRVMVYGKTDDVVMLVMPSVGFGHKNSSRINRFGGHQSIHNEDNVILAVTDGTIYNFLELKDFLEKKGHRFYTSTDSELVVHLYEELGEDCVNRFRGELAFAIWDKRKSILLLARDQIGVKPLYYISTGSKLIFASEIKPILTHPDVSPQINLGSLSEYLTFEYIPGPKSIFKKVEKLLPGHLLICKNDKISLKKYWDFSYQKTDINNEGVLCDRIISCLKESIKYRLINNEPKGVLLSGGIDSSIIVALMEKLGQRNIKTFSAIFESRTFNESRCSQIVAKHFATEHHKVFIKPQAAAGILPGLIYSLDEPLADVSIIPTYLVTRLAREKVTFCLTGDGGDELFGGYDTHKAYRFAEYYWSLPEAFRRIINSTVNLLPVSNSRGFGFRAKKFIEGINFPPEIAYYIWWGAYTPKEKEKLLSKEITNYLQSQNPFRVIELYLKKCDWVDPLDRIFYMDLKFNLPDGSLRKIERMGTVNSLELRYPFLDPRLVEFSATIPNSLKLKGLTTKYILRKAIKPYLPFKISKQPKRGLDIPLGDWIRKDLKTFITDILSKSMVKRQGFFNYSYIETLLKEHFSGKQNHRQKIWPLVVFAHWYETIFRGN